MKTKKIIIPTLVFLFLLITWSFIFYFNSNQKKDSDKIGEWHDVKIEKITKYEPIENYNIIDESAEIKKIENKNINFSFSIPNNWQVEKIKTDDISEIKISNSNLDLSLKGCEIRVGAVYFLEKENNETKADIIRKKIEEKKLIDDYQEIILIDNYSALKTIQYENYETEIIITVEKPFDSNNGIYFFNIYFPYSEKTKCLNSFNEFLKSVSFD